MRQRLSLIFCLLLSAPALAELSGQFRALTLNMPPFSISVDPVKREMQGYFGEIFVGAMRQAGLMDNIAVDMIPWKRAQLYALQQKNIILLPLVRTAAREEQYHWLKFIVSTPIYAWNISPNVAIDSLEDIRRAGLIGGLAGGPQSNEVRRILGPVDALKVEDSASEALALRKLLAGRVQVWSAHDLSANYLTHVYAQENGLAELKLHRGYKFIDADEWIAVSKQTSEADALQLQHALEAFFLTPEYQVINRKYHIDSSQLTRAQ